jgi:UDP-glucose 4-epimerase
VKTAIRRRIMRAVITGATGFIGSNVTSALLGRGDEVVALCRKGPRAEMLRKAGTEVVYRDLLDESTTLDLAGADVLLHYGSITTPRESVLDPDADKSNLDASERLLREAVEAAVGKIVFSTSGGTVYGDPVYIPVTEAHSVDPLIPYARTKVAIESALERMCGGSGTVPVSLRYGNPYGPNQYPARGTGVVTAWLESVRDRVPIQVFGSLESARDFVFIADVVEATLSAVDSRTARGTYNIGTGHPTSLGDVLATIEEVTGEKAEFEKLPSRPSDRVCRIALDSTRAFDHFGWRATTPLRGGVEKTWEWVREGEPFRVG